MLAEAHARGIRVVVDLVVNHTSEMHPWFIESPLFPRQPEARLSTSGATAKTAAPEQLGSMFSGSAWTLDETTGQYYLHTFGTFQPDLNWDNPAVREEVFKMMRWWCDKGVDGFRMDTISMISKTPEMPDGELRPGSDFGDFGPYVYNGPNVHKYLREMQREGAAPLRPAHRGRVLRPHGPGGLPVRQRRRHRAQHGLPLRAHGPGRRRELQMEPQQDRPCRAQGPAHKVAEGA